MDKPLVNAVDKGDEEAVKALLAAGYEHLEEREGRFGNTAFVLAASHGHQSILQALLAAGASEFDATCKKNTLKERNSMEGPSSLPTSLSLTRNPRSS
jgi:hypothetical protein